MNSIAEKIRKGGRNPRLIFLYVLNKTARLFPGTLFLRLKFRARMGTRLNLDDPQTFNEKLQWLKLHDRHPEYPRMVDKYEAKKYVAEIIGEQHIIPTLGVWSHFDDIDWDSLPDKFVLKTTHDSGGVVICKDKSTLDIPSAKRKLEASLGRNYYYASREWPYKNITPRIIAEAYMSDDSPENGGGLSDYKFSCFDGNAENVMVCIDRDKGAPKFYFFDKGWNLLRLNVRGKNAPADFTLPKPAGMDEMFEIARKLSAGIPYLRVDLYYVSGQIYFGELTFFPDSGMDANLLAETDELFGSKINLKITANENNRFPHQPKGE